MQVRLAFAVAVQAHNDILIVDEVLAVGDASFQQKCFSYFERLKLEKKTVIFVSHDIESVLRFCDRAALVKDGKVAALGLPEEVIDTYINPINKQTAAAKKKQYTSDKSSAAVVGHAVKVKYQLSSSSTGKIDPDNRPELSCELTNLLNSEQELNVEVVINKNFLQKVFWARSEWALRRRISLPPKASKEVIFKIQNIFPAGSYSVDIQLISKNETQLDYRENALDFEITRDGDNAWLWHPMLEVTEREIK
jgi:ABC-2 type transport system ATP-binding protein